MFKNFKNNPHHLALIDAALISLVAIVFYMAISVIWFSFRWEPLLWFLPAFYFFSYFIIRYSFNEYIFKRVKLIYKIIGHAPDKKVRKNETGPLEKVKEVVYQWGEEKKKEISDLKKMADYRREFLGNVSHELKTPIFNIQGYILTLLDGGLEDETINKKFLRKTEKSIERLINIVNDLEKIAKLEAGEMELQPEDFDLYELLEEVLDFLEIKAQKYQTVITVKPFPPKPFPVKADKESIREVLINLIENAIKYGDKTNNRIKIALYSMDEKVLVEINDNGIGIPQELLPRIFERFYRTDKGRSRDKGGSGLGLAIVKHIIEAHRQTITARSNIGEGTTFAFTLEKGNLKR